MPRGAAPLYRPLVGLLEAEALEVQEPAKPLLRGLGDAHGVGRERRAAHPERVLVDLGAPHDLFQVEVLGALHVRVAEGAVAAVDAAARRRRDVVGGEGLPQRPPPRPAVSPEPVEFVQLLGDGALVRAVVVEPLEPVGDGGVGEERVDVGYPSQPLERCLEPVIFYCLVEPVSRNTAGCY